MGRCIPFLVVGLLLAGCGRQEVARDSRAMLEQGWNYYRLGEFDVAAKHFTALTGNVEAIYALATTWNLRRPGEDRTKARALYEQVIREAPDSEWAAWSRLALARWLHLVGPDKTPDYEAARRAYQEVMDRHPRTAAADEAFVFQQTTYLAGWREEEARVALPVLERFWQERADSAWRTLANGLIARAHQILKQPDEWLAALVRGLAATEVDPLNPKPDRAGHFWQIATVAEFEAGNFAVAREYYRRFMTDYPTDARVYQAKQALARMDAVEARLRP